MPESKKRASLSAAIVAGSVVLSLLALLVVSLNQEEIPALVVEARKARASQDVQSQKAALTALAEADPQHIESLEGLARIAHDEGRWADAAGLWGKVAALDPLHEKARFEQARNLYAAGDYRGAVELLSAESLRNDPDAQALHAMTLLGAGRTEEAGALIERVLAAHPDHATARLLHADLLFLDGRLDAAEGAYRELLQTDEMAPSAWLGLAQVQVRRGGPDQAVALLREHPPGPKASYQLLAAYAELWRQTGHLPEAIGTYERLLKDFGPLPEVLVPLAELTAAGGKAEPITALQAKLTGTTAPALAARHYLDAIAAYLRQEPAALLQRLSLAQGWLGNRDLFRWMELDAALRLGDQERATAAVEQLDRMNLAPARRTRAADLIAEQAARWLDRDEQARASALAGLALTLVEDHAGARMVLARAELVGGHRKVAAEHASALLDHPGLRPAALEVLGRASLDDGDLASAEQRFRELAQAAPDTATGPYWLGVCLLRQGDAQGAVEQLGIAYRRSPQPRDSAALLDALLTAKDWDGALTLAEEQIARPEGPAKAIGWAYKAGVERARGDLAAAARGYREAMKLDPSRIPYALAAADLLIDLDDYAQAQAILDAAAQAEPDNRVVRFKRAYLAQLKGDAATAEKRYREILRDYPDWALVLVNLSEILGAAGATRVEGLDMAQRAAGLTPRWPVAQWNLAQRAMQAGDTDQARKAAEQTLTLAPDHAEARALLTTLDAKAQP